MVSIEKPTNTTQNNKAEGKQKTMNRYELLKANKKLIIQFINNGILSYQALRDIEIYESFIEMELNNREAKLLILSDEYELSSKRIEQIIYQMQKKVT